MIGIALRSTNTGFLLQATSAISSPLVLTLARHILERGTDGRFYSSVRKYHHEGGLVDWFMSATPEGATLINRCREDQTYEARLAAGMP